MYTDGLTEAVNGSGEEFGESLLAGALSKCGGLGASGCTAAILRAVRDFAGEVALPDDVTCLALCRES